MADFHPLRSLDEETTASASWCEKNTIAEKLAKEIPCATMPSLDHLKMKDFDEVYEPSDDTYLLLDCLQSEVSVGVFSEAKSSPMCVEIGCGSGVATTFLASQLRQNGMEPVMYVTDINPRALEVTKETAKANSGDLPCPIILESIRCDLLSALLPHLNHSFDALIFNPPYVPTPDDEVGGTSIEASWAGGTNGRKVVDRAIPQIAQILARPNGVGYMITVDDNQPEELVKLFQEVGLQMEPLVRRRAHNEYLSVQKLSWINKS